MDELNEIKAKMYEAVEVSRGGDVQDAHWDADGLLEKLVRVLAERLGKDVPGIVDDILDLYEQVGSW